MKEFIGKVPISEIPIPTDLPSIAGWKEVRIEEKGEELVALGPFSDYSDIFTDSIYFGERTDSPYPNGSLDGSLVTMFVRESIAEQLRQAQKLLPRGMRFIVFDSYRPLKVQASLYKSYYEALKAKNPEFSEEELSVETQKYVSLPSNDPTRPSPHNTGGAVDLAIFSLPDDVNAQLEEIDQRRKKLKAKDWQEAYTLEMRKTHLINKYGNLLNFGTPFDFGDQEAALNYFEKTREIRGLAKLEQEAMENRRVLFSVMTEVGFEPYPDEWWHYNSKKSQMGAKIAGIKKAEFGGKELSQQNMEHENMRENHWLGTIRIGEGLQPSRKVNHLREHFEVVRESTERTGDIRITSLPKAAIISPS